MSSPKRPRPAGTKPARAPAAPAPQPAPAVTDASVQASGIAAAIAQGIANDRLDVLSADALQALLAAACRLYAARREAGETFIPVQKNAISATDAMMTASGLLRATDLSTFELGMWQSWTGR